MTRNSVRDRRQIDNIVIVRFDERGEHDYEVLGDGVCLFIVDERAPNDRVYEWLPRATADEIKAILRDDPIGSSQDSRHEAIKNTILSAIELRPKFKVIADDK